MDQTLFPSDQDYVYERNANSLDNNLFNDIFTQFIERIKAKWHETPEQLLRDFLCQRNKDVKKLNKRGITAKKVKAILWHDASAMLYSNYFFYTPKQCAIKYKNIRQNEKKRVNRKLCMK
ncbi:19796_t:CDS:1 [Funneliformis geosporum]|uniref:19796_t:CDS:1 n=1 Tax=Funneliformis geosporum TaxID=1117311 RepID=A0A9W4SYS1_9GLOM|nr:19796_t:CDS:1 [Funneliformis geosporum]